MVDFFFKKPKPTNLQSTLTGKEQTKKRVRDILVCLSRLDAMEVTRKQTRCFLNGKRN